MIRHHIIANLKMQHTDAEKEKQHENTNGHGWVFLKLQALFVKVYFNPCPCEKMG